MNQSSSAPARALAATALVCGVLIVVIVIAISLGGDGESEQGSAGGRAGDGAPAEPSTRAAYVVQNGDTLTSIARETGVSVTRIQALNPGVDPQILVSGEKLKLR